MFLRPRQATDKVVAFFATLSSSQQEHLGPHQNIIFGDVETNIGGGYNYHHGVLVAPVSGLYLITATLLTSPNREIWAAIVVNGVEVARLNGRGTDGRHGSTSHAVIIQLQRGIDKMFPRPRQTAEKVVAFFATLSNSQGQHLGPHQNIIFANVRTNIGGGYNNHHGVFIAPVRGLYLITASLLTAHNGEIWAAIVVNGAKVALLNERGTDGRHGPTSHAVIIQLQRGDDVSVQNGHPDGSYWGDGFSSFGGFLIAEM